VRDRPGSRTVLLATALLGAAAALTLAAPHVDPAQAARLCIYPIELPRGFEVVFGCDGFTFLRGAVEPALLLEPRFAPPTDFTYQSRPLHIGVAAIVGRVLQPLVAAAVPAELRYQGRTPVRRFAGAYVAYVLLNAVLLVGAGLALQDALIGWRRPDTLEVAALVAGLAGLMLSRTVRFWLFTPHTFLWGLLVPLWALAVGRRVLAPVDPTDDRLVRRAVVAAGVAALAYAFAVLVPAVALTALGHRLRRDRVPNGIARWLRVTTFSAVAFALPTLAWIGVSYAVAGGYYHHEAVAYRQFRWLTDALVAGGPAAAWTQVVGRGAAWGGTLARQLLAPTLFLVSLVGVSVSTGAWTRATPPRALLGSAALVLGFAAAFWYLDGQMGGARAATLAPDVQVLAASLALTLDRGRGRVRWTGLLAAATIGWGVVDMMRPPA